MKFSTSLRRQREQRGISLRGLARKCGIAHNTLLGYEAGREPRIGEYCKIAQALGYKPGKWLDVLLSTSPRTEE